MSRLTTRIRAVLVVVIAVAVSGCAQNTTQNLVFGERTGLNIGISVDPAKASPLELNTGFRRQVVGIVPASKVDAQGRADGEAANMISHFELEQREANDGNSFDTEIAMRGAFISGQAALELVKDNDSTKLNNIINKVAASRVSVVTGSDKPIEINIEDALVAHINSNPEANAPDYLRRAKDGGLIITSHSLPQISAVQTAKDRRNAAGNKKIFDDLNLS